MIQAKPPVFRSSPVWYDMNVASAQQREMMGEIASQYGMQNPPFRRRFPPEVLIYQENRAFGQQHLNAAGQIIPPWPAIGSLETAGLSGANSLTPPNTRAVLAGCSCQSNAPKTTWSVSGLGSYKDMLETPMEQIREAIEYTLQNNQRSAQPQQWVADVNALQARMNVYVQENAWAFINAETGRPWEAPPSRSAAKVWAGLIDQLAGESMLAQMLSIFPQIKSLRDAWFQENDAAFAPVSPSERAVGTLVGMGLLGLVGWGIWRSMRRQPPPPAQPVA